LDLKKFDIKISDFLNAPSFIIKRDKTVSGNIKIEFISSRKKEIICVIMQKA